MAVGKLSRAKGQRGERELAGIVAALTGWECRRRVRQHAGDSDIEGIPGWSVEVKRAAVPNLREWWGQAVAQAAAGRCVPVLFYRLDRHDWRAMWPLAVLLAEQRSNYWIDVEWTCTTTIEAWAAVARNLVNEEIDTGHTEASAPDKDAAGREIWR